ncbi:hypothetical protein Zmor_017349 [Zophobas morio]|uniref:Uncharacterized protein n=1 Tax=Zophobas morio TaxID=2755281 RepID=A0AA38IC30_9CUCU|nr:hypothetical protein Zmor_017349 [Zophobas morio]
MSTIVEHFINQFHNIEGTTIALRHKNFFKLLHEIAPLVSTKGDALDAITLNLNPRTYLESLFRVDFLIYFRRSQELLNILKQGNDVFVSKIVKQVWFFKEVFGDVPAHQLVNEILPCMSFSVRMKILRKLSRFSLSEKFDEIYDALVNRYGLYFASQFITGCSPAKVRQILIENPVKLTSTQLKNLYLKDSQLIDFYFSYNKSSFDSQVYERLIRFIFNNDHALFDYLKCKYKLCTHLGRRATKKFVMLKKDEIIKNPYKFDYINMEAVLRKIGGDSVLLFRNALPEQIPDHFINSDWLFRSFPKKYHYSLFIKTFQDHYKIKLADHPAIISEELLKIIPDNKERAALAKVLVDTGHDEYLKYLLIEDSVRLIKEIINVTSDIKERGKLIKCVIETCRINNDIPALFDVMKYFCFRHKNDELNVHLQFINNIENLFGFKKFTEEMWATLNELLAIHMLKFDERQSTYEKIQTMPLVSVNLGTSVYQKLSYLEFLFKKGDVIDELVKEYFTTNTEFPEYSHYDKNFGKCFLLFVINNIAHNDIHFNYNLICEIDSWNNVYKDNQLSFYDFPILVHTFNQIIMRDRLAIEYPGVFHAFRNKIFTTEENLFKNEYMQMYWEHYKRLAKLTDIRWFLKYDPLTIVANLKMVFKMLNKKFNGRLRLNLWRQIKKFSHLQLGEKSIETCLTMLSDEEGTRMKSCPIRFLSVLMKPEDYAALADAHKPGNTELNLESENDVRRYKLQCAIAMHFKNTKSYEVLPSLLSYCTDDFFRYAKKSLYSLLYRTPENELPQYLNYLSNNEALSVHALYITCELTASSKIESILKQETQSLQRYLFPPTINYFVKNPSDSIFELVKMYIPLIIRGDEKSLNILMEHLTKIPQKYRAQYIPLIWNCFENTVYEWEKLLSLKKRILSCVTCEIAREIPLEFGVRVIQQHLFANNKDRRRNPNIVPFMFIFLSSKDEKQLIFNKIFSFVDQCTCKEEMFTVLRDLYHQVMSSTSDNLRYMEPYVNYFEKKVSLTEDFYDFIKIFFLKCKLESSQWTVDHLANKILVFFEEVVAKCGPWVIHLFAREMNVGLAYFAKKPVTRNEFYCAMMKQRPIPIVAILLLEVVSEPSCGSSPDGKAHYHELLQLIKNIEDPAVQIFLGRKKYKSYGRSVSEDRDDVSVNWEYM